VSDINKQTDNIHADGEHTEDVMDSDELFDLDMPLDEPEDTQNVPETEMQSIAPESESSDISDSLQHLMDEFPDSDRQDSETKQPEEEQETLLTVEKDLEHLLDRSDSNNEENLEQPPQPIRTEADADSVDASTPAKTEPMAEMPVAEKSKAKSSFGMANSFMVTLGLIAILIASLAGWLGLDASQQQSNLALVSSNLQQQIKLLEQQQEQQNLLLTQHIETLEKRLNTLTQVIANKTTEKWRASLQQKPAVHAEKPAPASIQTALPKPILKPAPKPKQPVIQADVKKKDTIKKKTITPSTPAKSAGMPVAAVKSVAKPLAAPAQLSMYEVAPGTVKGWVVNIYSAGSKSTAKRRIRQLKSKNIDAQFVRVQVKGKTWYRVRSSGFKDKRSAISFKKFLKEYHGIDAWHSYLK